MIEKISQGLLKKWRDTVEKHCLYGKENFCDGKPTVRGGRKRRPCLYYDTENKKCTQPNIAECKEKMKYYIEGERKNEENS